MSFAQLGADLIRLIAEKLPCKLDRSSMAAVCTSWHEAITEVDVPLAPPHRLLPLLLFPNAESPSCSCVLCGGDLKDVLLREDARGRFFGSYEDSWLFIAMEHVLHHAAVNLRTGQFRPLPDGLLFERNGYCFGIVIEATTISTDPMDEAYVAASIVACQLENGSYQKEIMFCTLGSHTGWGLLHQDIHPDNIEDIIFFDGLFHLLTSQEHIFTVSPQFTPKDWFLEAEVKKCYFGSEQHYHLEQPRGRYLVQSRGELLLVVRCQQWNTEEWYTSSFRVYRMEKPQDPDDDAVYSWLELDELEGRAIFLARGCSKAYEVNEYPGSVEGVFFKGDLDWWTKDWMGLSAEDRRDMLDENGVWLGPPLGPILPCFKMPDQIEGEFHFSPPVWIIPRVN